jgi:hypothetical protein
MPKIKLAVIGSRTFKDYELLKTSILLHYEVKNLHSIISGGARGADQLSEQFAHEHNIATKLFLPDWVTWGKLAGYKRNFEIIEACDEVMGFWDGTSRGTKHSLDIAEEQKKKLTIVYF